MQVKLKVKALNNVKTFDALFLATDARRISLSPTNIAFIVHVAVHDALIISNLVAVIYFYLRCQTQPLAEITPRSKLRLTKASDVSSAGLKAKINSDNVRVRYY